jgi:O-antigen/teichoic acid export membrane protein
MTPEPGIVSGQPVAPAQQDSEVAGRSEAAPRRIIERLADHIRTPLFGNAYALIVNTGATALLGLGYWILAARLYTPAQVGAGNATISAMLLLAGIGGLNLYGALTRFVPCAGHATARLVRWAYGVSAVGAAIVATVFLLASTRMTAPGAALRFSGLIAAWFALAVIGQALFELQDGVLTGLRQTIWVPVENMAFGLAKILLLVLFAALWPNGGVFASWTIPLALSLALVSAFIFGRLVPRYEQRTARSAVSIDLRQVCGFVAGDYLGALCLLAAFAVPPLLVTAILGPTANAYFSIAWIMAGTLEDVALAIATSLTVEGAADERRLAEHMQTVLRHSLVLLAPIVVAILALAPWILRLFGARYASHGTTLLRLLVVAALLKAVTLLFVGMCRVRRRVSRIVAVHGGQCGLLLGFAVPLIHRWGINGVGVAACVAEGIVVLAITPTLVRFLRQQHEVLG